MRWQPYNLKEKQILIRKDGTILVIKNLLHFLSEGLMWIYRITGKVRTIKVAHLDFAPTHPAKEDIFLLLFAFFFFFKCVTTAETIPPKYYLDRKEFNNAGGGVVRLLPIVLFPDRRA